MTVVTGSGTDGTGDVVVQSISYGTTSKADAFTYGKRDQVIDFPEIGGQLMSDSLNLSATANSGLPIDFSLVPGSPAILNNGTNLMFNSAGSVSVVASQSGDAT